MEPTLRAGQGLIASRSRRAKPGQIRCVEHPDRPGFWLVKRVTELPTPTTMWVESDNGEVSTTDSRTLGPLDVAGSWRVVVRIPLRLM